MAEGAGDSTPPRITGADIADMALLLASLIPAVRASRIGSAAVRGLGRVGQRVLDRARGNEKPSEAPKPAAKPKPDITKRPEGVPKDWKERSTKSGNGRIYQHPTEKGTYVKVEKGKPNASQPGQRYDNVRVQKNGQSYDVNGNKVPQQSQESHIPLEDFKFDPGLFK